ncbi:hypothetical protein BaRGS_00025668, partial [Batillaria attramentaria]
SLRDNDHGGDHNNGLFNVDCSRFTILVGEKRRRDRHEKGEKGRIRSASARRHFWSPEGTGADTKWRPATSPIDTPPIRVAPVGERQPIQFPVWRINTTLLGARGDAPSAWDGLGCRRLFRVVVDAA